MVISAANGPELPLITKFAKRSAEGIASRPTGDAFGKIRGTGNLRQRTVSSMQLVALTYLLIIPFPAYCRAAKSPTTGSSLSRRFTVGINPKGVLRRSLAKSSRSDFGASGVVGRFLRRPRAFPRGSEWLECTRWSACVVIILSG